jgi:hypothetical protein
MRCWESDGVLLRFRVRNHASLRDEQELSLVTSAGAPSGIPVEGADYSVLPVAAIYGSNASGKSNVIKAFRFALETIRDSHQRWLPDEAIPRWPFRLDGTSTSEPSSFALDFLMDEVRYEYGFALSDETVTEEWLYSWPRGKRVVLFSRLGSDVTLGRGLGGNKAAIKELVRPNSLFLSAGAANNHELLGSVSQFFGSRYNRVHDRTELLPAREQTFNRVVRNASHDPQLMDLIRFADLGIVGMAETEPQPEVMHASGRKLTASEQLEVVRMLDSLLAAKGPLVSWLHEAAPDAGAVSIPPVWESYGTVEWMFLISNALSMLRAGGILLVDDLGGHLHPSLVAQLVKLFLQPTVNRHRAQLIFNTHDVSLLWRGSEAHLGRDQIWFTKKARDGATSLYPLTDFRARDNVDDFMGRYLHGRYEGVPYFDDTLLESLGEGSER